MRCDLKEDLPAFTLDLICLLRCDYREEFCGEDDAIDLGVRRIEVLRGLGLAFFGALVLQTLKLLLKPVKLVLP